jgi:hypothetical protein
MTTQPISTDLPARDEETHAGIPDWVGFLITAVFLSFWAPRWLLLAVLAMGTFWSAWVTTQSGWNGYLMRLNNLAMSKWIRAGGWLFVFLGKIIGYLVALVCGGIASVDSVKEPKDCDDEKGPNYIKHAYWDEKEGWIDSNERRLDWHQP